MRRLFRATAAKLTVLALVALLAAGAALAATGTLPEALQDVLANAVDNLGVDLPGGADDRRAAAPEPVDADETNATDPGRAFRAPRGDGGEGRGGVGSGRRYYEPDYGDYYREYFGLEEDDDDDAYVPVAPRERSGDGGYYHPGQPGEPGEPGIPDSDDDAPGESDGTPGEAGPPGDPG